MKKSLVIILCLGILLVIVGAGLFVWYMAGSLLHGRLPFHISRELLDNPPISLEPGIERRIICGTDPTTLFVNRPGGFSNAAVSYLEVVRSVNSREKDISPDGSSPQPFMLTDEDLRIFLDGVDQADCDFSRESLVLDGKPVRLAPAVDVADNLAHLQYFRKISRAVVERGEQYQSDGDPEMALRCYEGVVKFGGDIERGRESLLQVFLGAAVQKSGARKLKEFYENTGDAERSRQWSDFLIDLDEFSGRFKEKMKKLKIAAGFGSEMAANGLWILENDDDHVFRREALAGLGAAKVFAPSIIGPPLERTAANDPDPYVREAAKNALRFGDTANERRQ